MMTMLERDKIEAVIEDIKIMSDYPWHHKLNYILEHDQAQRVVIEQQAKEIAELRQTCGSRHREIERLVMRIWTLRETLQACQNRLGCGCGDILCTICSATYDVAEQALKEVS